MTDPWTALVVVVGKEGRRERRKGGKGGKEGREGREGRKGGGGRRCLEGVNSHVCWVCGWSRAGRVRIA